MLQSHHPPDVSPTSLHEFSSLASPDLIWPDVVFDPTWAEILVQGKPHPRRDIRSNQAPKKGATALRFPGWCDACLALWEASPKNRGRTESNVQSKTQGHGLNQKNCSSRWELEKNRCLCNRHGDQERMMIMESGFHSQSRSSFLILFQSSSSSSSCTLRFSG